jgi:rhodanese-related sulfurtransferase
MVTDWPFTRWPGADNALSVFRLGVAHGLNELRQLGAIPFQADPFGRCRVVAETRARAACGDGPDRAWLESAAAVRADIGQHRLNAVRAERALVTANPGIRRMRRKVLVAILTIGPQLQPVRQSFGESCQQPSGAKVLAMIAFLSHLFRRPREAAPTWIECDELQCRLAASDAPVLIDVRQPEEFTAPPGHLPGAVNLPLADLAHRTAELAASGRGIVVVCKTDRRSAQAAAALLAAGIQGVAVLRGGTDGWHRRGLALE